MHLSPRETTIVRMVASSLTSRDIAKKLRVSHRTVENQRASAMRKLGVNDTAALTRFAIGSGLIRNEYNLAHGTRSS